jgi:hypothetical protein
VTLLAGLPASLDPARAMRPADAADRRLALRSRSRGWTDGQIIAALAMLNLAGGDCVDDLKILEPTTAGAGCCRPAKHAA